MSALLDIDAASAALISQLALEEIAEIRDSSKGKGRAGAPLSDGDCAFSAYEEEMQDMLRFFQDLELARSLDNALELDQPALSVLSVVEDGARDDHAYAAALERGEPLPAQSEVQRLMEDPDFARLSAEEQGTPGTAPVASESEGEFEIEVGPSVMARPVRPARAQCIACGDILRAMTSFKAACEHFYCRPCLSNLATTCIGDESLYPLRCCSQNLPIDGTRGVYAYLEVRLRISFTKKAQEYTTVFKNRLYCPRPTCSTFLGSIENHLENPACPRCATEVCIRCKQIAHFGDACGENVAIEQVKALAREQHWQTCPGCGQIIDLQQGCFHMTCRCRTEFCYVCAARWKNCTCPQWDEARLIVTAEQRVQNEMGPQARAVAPAIFQQRVEQRVERLRYEHDCALGHRWYRRNGGARCEECRYRLPDYLLVCRSCGIAACVRCARNRL
ncbi:RBR-type E3 ubiquitin transferase [Favolaschia claudopus]|uniref:RBR-type E3 ubiquitin transferase n=1 Tax=Favolaschia claudopus TaxID=2862362 RepID=A0AAW0DL42_9AGAR